jgi:hypothetical protein
MGIIVKKCKGTIYSDTEKLNFLKKARMKEGQKKFSKMEKILKFVDFPLVFLKIIF